MERGQGGSPTVVLDSDDGGSSRSESPSLAETTQIPVHPIGATDPISRLISSYARTVTP